ncbi:BnaCnng30560D [Brassica napus]|uniref:(rape) hypothetical protein n=1 Tax=Brassica napus TaxID=3708 RepID=A0A078IXC0_BRANA|nr:unnamed protein product [Brassica napus]CDY56514.1 BnaCnng30560D [Brassica napus]
MGIFSPLTPLSEDHKRKKVRKEAAATARASAKDAAVRAGDPDEEKYRLGYGVAGKGVKLPWYVENKREYEDRAGGEGEEEEDGPYDTASFCGACFCKSVQKLLFA